MLDAASRGLIVMFSGVFFSFFLAVNQLLCTKSHLLWVYTLFGVSRGGAGAPVSVILDLSGFASVFQSITLYFNGFNFHERLN